MFPAPPIQHLLHRSRSRRVYFSRPAAEFSAAGTRLEITLCVLYPQSVRRRRNRNPVQERPATRQKRPRRVGHILPRLDASRVVLQVGQQTAVSLENAGTTSELEPQVSMMPRLQPEMSLAPAHKGEYIFFHESWPAANSE